MALTATQKATIRLMLGYSDISQGDGYSVLEGQWPSLSAEAETQIATILTDYATVQAALRTGWSQLGVSRVEDVYMSGADGVRNLRAEGNRLATNLATILGVPVQRLPFATQSGGFTRRG